MPWGAESAAAAPAPPDQAVPASAGPAGAGWLPQRHGQAPDLRPAEQHAAGRAQETQPAPAPDPRKPGSRGLPAPGACPAAEAPNSGFGDWPDREPAEVQATPAAGPRGPRDWLLREAAASIGLGSGSSPGSTPRRTARGRPSARARRARPEDGNPRNPRTTSSTPAPRFSIRDAPPSAGPAAVRTPLARELAALMGMRAGGAERTAAAEQIASDNEEAAAPGGAAGTGACLRPATAPRSPRGSAATPLAGQGAHRGEQGGADLTDGEHGAGGGGDGTVAAATSPGAGHRAANLAETGERGLSGLAGQRALLSSVLKAPPGSGGPAGVGGGCGGGAAMFAPARGGRAGGGGLAAALQRALMQDRAAATRAAAGACESFEVGSPLSVPLHQSVIACPAFPLCQRQECSHLAAHAIPPRAHSQKHHSCEKLLELEHHFVWAWSHSHWHILPL